MSRSSRWGTGNQSASRRGWLVAAGAALVVGCATGTPEIQTDPLSKQSDEVQGVNLAGSNLAGTNLAGSNLAGTNLAGFNLGGNNLAGNNLAGSNLAGTNLGGNNLAGSNLAGSNLAGSNLAGSNLAGSNLAGTNLAGNNLAGTNLSGSNLAGSNTGANIHALAAAKGMLYSGEDLWLPKTGQCIVSGIGSTAFAKLLGQQSANATMYAAVGKLPWGFSAVAGGPVALQAWEAVVWGDKTYCSFVMATPVGTTSAGVSGFIKAVFRWNAPPTQTINISGIEASAPYDSTLSTSILTYTGMMNLAQQWKLGKVNDKNFVAGEVAFVSATTNNQSVMVDFSSWVTDTTNNGLIVGNVQAVNPPTRAESVYYVVDNGDGTVSTKIAAAASGLTTVSDTFEALNAAWSSFQGAVVAKPVPRRCGGALYLNYYYGEPVPAGKCDDGLSWGNASSAVGSRKWSTVAGTTAPMNQYMLLPLNATTPLMRGTTADDLKVVLSETYVHTWDSAYDAATGLTMVDDSTTGTGLNKFNFSDDSNYWSHTSTNESYKGTDSWEGTNGKYATLTFQGTTIHLYGPQQNRHGIAAISLDGGPEKLVDFYRKERHSFQMYWSASNLTPGVNHTVKIRATGTKNPLAVLPDVSIDAAEISNAVCVPEPDSSLCTRLSKNCGSITAIDNCGATRTVASCGSCTSPLTCGGSNDANVCGNGEVVDDKTKGTGTNQFEYSSSGWVACLRCGNASLFNSSKTENKTAGAYVKFRFNGVKVKFYGVKAPNYGIGAVSIDGGSETNIDFFNATMLGDQLLWTSPQLSNGAHTLTLRVTGSKNPSASDSYVAVDRAGVIGGGSGGSGGTGGSGGHGGW